jgi:hypothetical protein
MKKEIEEIAKKIYRKHVFEYDNNGILGYKLPLMEEFQFINAINEFLKDIQKLEK